MVSFFSTLSIWTRVPLDGAILAILAAQLRSSQSTTSILPRLILSLYQTNCLLHPDIVLQAIISFLKRLILELKLFQLCTRRTELGFCCHYSICIIINFHIFSLVINLHRFILLQQSCEVCVVFLITTSCSSDLSLKLLDLLFVSFFFLLGKGHLLIKLQLQRIYFLSCHCFIVSDALVQSIVLLQVLLLSLLILLQLDHQFCILWYHIIRSLCQLLFIAFYLLEEVSFLELQLLVEDTYLPDQVLLVGVCFFKTSS